MTDVISHRGPDDDGFYIAPGLALGHRRLSIIDVSSHGHQPMFNESGEKAIVYNGEIYNHSDLRPALEISGSQATVPTAIPKRSCTLIEQYGP